MGKNDFYDSATPSVDFFSNSTAGTEPNMRQEFINMMDGSYPEIAKAQGGLLRRMRRNSSGQLIACGCVDAVTREPDRDRFCPVCYGEGNLWDEEELDLYRTLEDSDVDNVLKNNLQGPGLINVPLVVFYIRYDSDITRDDKIIELVLDTAGDAVTPRQRKRLFRINSAHDYRADNGKLEYWKVFAHHEDVKYLNAPTYGEV
jgi:hypothetical protein